MRASPIAPLPPGPLDLEHDAGEHRARIRTLLWWGSLAVITCIGLLVRLAFINQPLKSDETFTLTHFATGWYSFCHGYLPNNHPLNTFLMHFSVRLAPGTEWAMRLPVFLAGVAMIPAAAFAARRLYDRRVALLAAAWLAASSALIDYATNARGYSLVAVFFLLMLGMAARLRTHETWSGWAALVLCAALGFFSVAIMLYPAGVVGGWLLMSAAAGDTKTPPGRFVLHLACAAAAAVALTLLLYVPLIVGSGWNAVTNYPELTRLSYAAWLAALHRNLGSVLSVWMRDIPWIGRIVLAAGLLLGLIFHRRMSESRIPAVAGLAWCAVVVALQRISPFPRVWLFVLPLVFITASAGWLALLPRRLVNRSGVLALVAGAAILLAASGSYLVYHSRSPLTSGETGALPDAPQMARTLKRMTVAGDSVIWSIGGGHELMYYMKQCGVRVGYFRHDGATDADRLLIAMAGRPDRAAIQKAVRDAGADPADFAAPVLVHYYPNACLYQCARLPDHPAPAGEP